MGPGGNRAANVLTVKPEQRPFGPTLEAVGTALARLLGVPYRDSDEEIVKAAQRSVAEIFERDGEPFFRARESEVLSRLVRGEP